MSRVIHGREWRLTKDPSNGKLKTQAGKRPLGQRIRSGAKANIESVVKVVSFASDNFSARKLFDYIRRDEHVSNSVKQSLEIFETRDGQTYREDADLLFDEWSRNFSSRANARNVAHIVVSLPKDVDDDIFHKGVREFGQRYLQNTVENMIAGDLGRPDYDYGFTIHSDTDHKHAHFFVVRDNVKSKPLRWGPKDLQFLREGKAEVFSELGLNVTATLRSERGKGLRGEKLAIRKQAERDGFSQQDLNAAQEIIDIVSGKRSRNTDDILKSEILEKAVLRRAEERKVVEELASTLETMQFMLDKRGNKDVLNDTIRSVRAQAAAFRRIDTREKLMREILFEAQSKDKQSLSAKELARSYRLLLKDRGKRAVDSNLISEERMTAAIKKFDENFGKQMKYWSENADKASLRDTARRMMTIVETMGKEPQTSENEHQRAREDNYKDITD